MKTSKEEAIAIFDLFLKILLVQPPLIPPEDGRGLPQLKQKLTKLSATEVDAAAAEIQDWCRDRPGVTEAWRLASRNVNPPASVSEKIYKFPHFSIQSTSTALSIQPEVSTIGGTPRKRPLLEYTIDMINKKIMENRQ